MKCYGNVKGKRYPTDHVIHVRKGFTDWAKCPKCKVMRPKSDYIAADGRIRKTCSWCRFKKARRDGNDA